MNTKNTKIILASASPRRKELLEKAGFNFDIIVSGEEEYSETFDDPMQEAIENAKLKASSVARKNHNIPVIGADTVVALGGKVYGKPKDIANAKQMLTELSGKTHSVFTGICAAISKDDENINLVLDARESRVRFKALTSSEIEQYLSMVNVLDKAGAYAAQEHGNFIIENIDGAFDNVMGLPVDACEKILDTLSKFRQS